MKAALLIAIVIACWATVGEMDYQDALRAEQAKADFMAANPNWMRDSRYVQP